MPAPFEILDVDVDPQNWTPVVAPFGCNNIAIKNTLPSDLKICTDLSRPDQDIISSLVQEAVVAPLSGAPFWRDATASPYRFMPGSTVAYLQTVSGTGTVKVRFVR
ncbi:MAG TPA: hypothetical protein VMT32_06670 [Bryobacteraceae bacterium]|nr:hypothetical protein [Bryobacteraceae bacterium]